MQNEKKLKKFRATLTHSILYQIIINCSRSEYALNALTKDNQTPTQQTTLRREYSKNEQRTNLWRWNDRESGDDPVGIFLPHAVEQSASQSPSRPPSDRMSHLDSLEAVAALRFLPRHVKYRVSKYSAVSMVATRPVIRCRKLTSIHTNKTVIIYDDDDDDYSDRSLLYNSVVTNSIKVFLIRDSNEHKPNTKFSGLKSCPNGPDRTVFMVPGSRSTSTARGTNLPPATHQPPQRHSLLKATPNQSHACFPAG